MPCCYLKNQRLLILLLMATLTGDMFGQPTQSDQTRAEQLAQTTRGKVLNAQVKAHWFPDGSGFWYRRQLQQGNSEYVTVEVRADGTDPRTPAFDHVKFAQLLEQRSGTTIQPNALPIDVDDITREAVQFRWSDKTWRFRLADQSLSEIEAKDKQEPDEHKRSRRDRGRQPQPLESPDGRWEATIRDHNVIIQNIETTEQFPLTTDGNEDHFHTHEMAWSPDSTQLIVMRQTKGQQRRVFLVESTPADQLQPKLHHYDYLKPGDRIPQAKPRLFNITTRKEIPIEDGLFSNPWQIGWLHWTPDSNRFTFLYNQRGHQVLRIVAVDAKTGETKTVIDEKSETFLDYAHKQFHQYIDDTNEVVWMSERDGWNHLYLYDAITGTVKNQITLGPWVVRHVDRIDLEKRQVWFQASGIDPEQDPYYIHFCRIDFDGGNLVRLTEGDGTHSIEYSPDGNHFLDRWSRVDLPTVTQLRRTSDGSLIGTVERADWSALLDTCWQLPERFHSKGRDNVTDIYGVIFRPTTFDRSRQYPVIEKIYAGPHGSFVPKGFSPFHDPQALAELGFIVVQIDGMGTSHRSKAFHDVCCKNLGDSGFPDRIAWMRAAADRYPQMDLTRVGIYGGSAGGQSATRALLAHGDFYKVAVSDCGCHDNRMDKIWWNELWMGWPVGPHYEQQSNVTNAHRLTGKLLLIVGELDRNVDPSSTLQMVDALIKADKDFDMLLVPGGGHGIGSGRYGLRRRNDFFLRHLACKQ